MELNERLLTVRFTKLLAELGPSADAKPGGMLVAEVTAGLFKVEKNQSQAVAQIRLQVKGIPSEVKDKKQFAFQVDLICQGVYEWPASNRQPDLKDPRLNRRLCHPIYVMAAAEVAQIATRMGAGFVRMPMNMDGQEAEDATARRVPRKVESRKKLVKK